MSLYGINAYTSNYNSLYSGLYNNRKSFGSSTADLLELAKAVDKVRSPAFRKATADEIRNMFSSDENSSSTDNSLKVSETAKDLNKYAGELAASGMDFSDPEKNLTAVKNFVESYNTALDNIQESDSTSILAKGVQMVNTTNAYSRTLGRIGISVGSDNRLTLNEDTLKNASAGTLKSLFSGSYSYANKIADKASYVNRSASLQAQYTNPYSYNNKGGLDYYSQLATALLGKY